MDKSEGQVSVNVFDTGFGANMADFVYYKIRQPSVAEVKKVWIQRFRGHHGECVRDISGYGQDGCDSGSSSRRRKADDIN